ncbi:unnamed protein product [Closterium sp. Yama58-4]|nr:unnamed protein product [Closterium sp. Yama58-4]
MGMALSRAGRPSWVDPVGGPTTSLLPLLLLLCVLHAPWRATDFSSRRALGACGGFLPAVRPEARGGFLPAVRPEARGGFLPRHSARRPREALRRATGTCASPPVTRRSPRDLHRARARPVQPARGPYGLRQARARPVRAAPGPRAARTGSARPAHGPYGLRQARARLGPPPRGSYGLRQARGRPVSSSLELHAVPRASDGAPPLLLPVLLN